jgi:hypothetical protein
VVAEHRGQLLGQRGRAERAGQQGGDGDADLHGGQEPVGVLGQPGGALTALAPLHQRAHLAVTQRNKGHLGGGEETADQNYDQDDDDVPADVVHFVIPDLGKSAWPRGVRSV